MVLVGVREDERLHLVEPPVQVAEVRQDQVHAGLVGVGEQHAAVHDEQAAAVLEDRHVPADLAEPAERDDAQAVARELAGRARSGCGWLTRRSPVLRQLHAARGEVKRQLMSFRVGGGQQRGAHRAARQAEQVERRLGHYRALVAEHPVVHRHELVVDLPGPAHVARIERVDHLVQPVADHVADHADETDRAEGEPRQVQHVGAAVVDEVGLASTCEVADGSSLASLTPTILGWAASRTRVSVATAAAVRPGMS